MYHFCTITTYDHLYKTYALLDSIRAAGHPFVLHILTIDSERVTPVNDSKHYILSDMAGQPLGEEISQKYKGSKDKLRWSMKPVFLNFLLEGGANKVICLDNDICFYDDYSFLFELLDHHSFLLTPHHYSRNPAKEQNWFEANFKVGLYNAGFVAVNAGAKPHLQWWAECCLYRVEKNPLRGLFDDQKYLDLIPIIAEDTLVLKHKGCNVAEWNRAEIKRSVKADDSVWLDDTYRLIFIHYNNTTIRAIQEGFEPCLVPSFELYLGSLRKYKPGIQTKDMIKPEKWIDKIKYQIWKLATRLDI